MKRRTADEERERMRARRERLRAEGRCYRCENRLDCDSIQHCASCLAMLRDYARERYGKRKDSQS